MSKIERKKTIFDFAQMKYRLTTPKFQNDKKLKKDVMDFILQYDMAPLYEEVCEDLSWQVNDTLLQQMKRANEEQLKKLDEAIEDAEKNLGEMEVREAFLNKAKYLSRIGAKDTALAVFRKTQEKTVSLGHRLDLLFHIIRIGLFYIDHDLITRNIEKAKSLIKEGADLDRRNTLKVYQGVYCMANGDYQEAAGFFLDTVSTFTCDELMDYETFVIYTVLCSMFSLSRVDLEEKIMKGSEIMEVLHSASEIKEYVLSLYNCEYAVFFIKLAFVEKVIKQDRFFATYLDYYLEQMRIIAYTQFLESSSPGITVNYMAHAFGVTVDFMRSDLSKPIVESLLHCQIDKVGRIETKLYSTTKQHSYSYPTALQSVSANQAHDTSKQVSAGQPGMVKDSSKMPPGSQHNQPIMTGTAPSPQPCPIQKQLKKPSQVSKLLQIFNIADSLPTTSDEYEEHPKLIIRRTKNYKKEDLTLMYNLPKDISEKEIRQMARHLRSEFCWTASYSSNKDFGHHIAIAGDRVGRIVDYLNQNANYTEDDYSIYFDCIQRDWYTI